MKKKLLIVSAYILSTMLCSCGGSKPVESSLSSSSVTSSEEVQKQSIGNIIEGDVRVQILNESTVRFEKRYNGEFCDDNTLTIPDRSIFKGVVYTEDNDDYNHYIHFGENLTITIPHDANTLKGVTISKGEKQIYSYSVAYNTGELPAPSATPDTFTISDRPRTTIPEGGYKYRGNADVMSGYRVQDKAEDVYVILPFGNAKALRQQYVNLTGKSEMVRLATLGLWDSKYFAYSDATAQEEIDCYTKYDLPIDNIVIDTDWRKSSATGIGYDINTSLFPDMEGFLESVHDQNIEVTFNDHPEPVGGSSSLFDPLDVQYRHEKLTNLLEMGLDTWWYDRNWSTALKSPNNNISFESLGMYLFQDITRQHYKERDGSDEVYTRPVIMGNVDNIVNGNYQKMRSSASHRYSIQWTGDINADSTSLAQEVSNIVKTGNNSFPYISSDLGGHNGNPTNEMYARWIQYGALSPIFRPHSSKYNNRYRQPWLYGEDMLDMSREYINMRYRLLSYYYALAYENYQTGLPLCRSLELSYQDDENCKREDEFMVGENILFAPITDDIYCNFPDNWFIEPVKATYYNNETLSGTPVATNTYSNMTFNWGTSSPMSGVNQDSFSASFESKIKTDQDVKLAVKVDDGVRIYINGEKVLDRFVANDSVTYESITLNASQEYDIKIEYYEGAGNAYLNLLYKNSSSLFNKSLYLPEGKWMDTFTGEVYDGKQTISLSKDIYTSPIFVRLGGILPLIDEAHNTASIDWKNITMDYYPSKTDNDHGYIYEDDTKTTGYQLGQNRISNYKAYFDQNEKCYIINLGGAKANFETDVNARHMKIRFHEIEGQGKPSKATINGNVVSMNYLEKDSKSYPFETQKGASDSNVYEIEFDTATAQDNQIKVYIK